MPRFRAIRFHEVRKAEGVLSRRFQPARAIVIDELVVCMAKADEGRAHSFWYVGVAEQARILQLVRCVARAQVLEDDTVLMHLFDDAGSVGNAPPIRSRSASARGEFRERAIGVSVVAAQYGSGDAQGVVAVIGPYAHGLFEGHQRGALRENARWKDL